MKPLNSTLELGDAIESLVASYMESVREAAGQAVARALASRSAPRSRRRSSSIGRTLSAKSSSTTSMARRTATEMDAVCDALCERVRAQPGASMVELAEQMGTGVRSLHRPMSKLKSAGLVRSVGQRHLMRYFPAVGTASNGT